MRYYIIAGEASGDLHGSNLMKELYGQDPEADIRFWGGPLMNAVFKANQTGEGLVHDYKEGAVMGVWEVIVKARKLLGSVHDCEEDILAWKPDVVILIDYPGFNFKIAKFAHSRGFKVFYYIAPKVWASRESRVKKLKRDVDKLFIVFPFEKDYFTRKGVDYIYKGNPLVDAIDGSAALSESREAFLKRTGLPDKPSIALLAGSRKPEIGFMMPRLTAFADKMHALPQYSEYQFIIAGAPSRTMADYAPYIQGREDYIKVIFNQTYSILHHSNAAVINSGTASLEAALIGTPQVVGYGSSALTFNVARQIIKIRFISLANLIINRNAFRELLQYYFTPDNVVAEIRRILEDNAYRERMLSDYNEIRDLLGGSGASAAMAKAMIDALK